MKDFSPTDDRDEQATEHAAIQVDAYGIKARVQPADVEEADSTTWKKVGKAISKQFKRFAVGLFTLPNEVIYGSIRLIRGLTSVPGAVAKRIEGAHLKAEKVEGIKLQELENGQALALPATDAAEAMERKLLALNAKGLAVVLDQVDQESWVIAVIRPGHVELAKELGTNVLKQLESDADDGKNTPDIPFVELKGSDVTAWVGPEKKSPRQLESQADADDRKDPPDASLDLAED